MQVKFLKKKYQEKWENAHLTIKNVTASGGPKCDPRPQAYRVMFLQTKVNEQIRPLIVSDKEMENYICQNVQNLSY